ncbi:MAG: hypothetical protein WC458_03510 [Patescibacteria group bacterium]
MKTKKRLVVCDYPNPQEYTFPNFSLGSTEKRFWEIAKTVSEFDDFEVIITGPLWLPEYLPKAKYFDKRLDEKTVDNFLKKFGRVDYLFAGSEYFDKDNYREAFFRVSNKLISYVTHIYDFNKVSFDNKKSFLFCYSDEMYIRYLKQNPNKLLLFHTGVDEIPLFEPHPQRYLIWLGRIDFDKSPHYAILAAEKLKIPIYILGKTVLQPEYEKKYGHLFESRLVKKMGVVSGHKKMELISNALCGIYTCGPDFLEAGAATLGEMMCSGIPIAGISWRGNDAVCEAINNSNLGRVFVINKKVKEDRIVKGLAKCITDCEFLDRKTIYDIGNYRYDMKRLMREMFNIVDYH